jgi:hypothetical protein
MATHDTGEAQAGTGSSITLADGTGNPRPEQEPIARITIDLYSLDRLVTVSCHIPPGSELEPLFGRGPQEVTGWRMVVATLKRNLGEIVDIKERRWWRSEDARFKAGQRVRMAGNPNFPTPAVGAIAESPPRRVGPGVLYRIQFDEPQVNRHNGKSYPYSDVLESFLEPLSETNPR